MSSTIHLNEISKQFGDQVLFESLSFTIGAQCRIGIIGPNGKGKSTFLKILAGLEEADSGEVHVSNDLVISCADQLVPYDLNKSVQEIISEHASRPGNNKIDAYSVHAFLDRFGITDLESPLARFSGGQRKKVQLSIVFSEDANLLLLDEPSNHLDMESIEQLGQILQSMSISIIMISHDRTLLGSFAREILEINPIYPNCYFAVKGGYEQYLQHREAFLEADAKNIASMKNRARTELAWLRQGVKARGTKARYRQNAAHSLLSDVEHNVKRRKQKKAEIEFSASGRKTRDLIEFESVSFGYDENILFRKLDFTLRAGDALGILGPNGSGKSTILKLILSELTPHGGNIKRAPNLSVSYFSQFSSHIDENTPMDRVLAPDGDSVMYQGSSIHVAAWATRFGFDSRSLRQPYGSLSGGEKARLRIASLMLETPDILLLDEPTNDLDIMTLEVLEESLLAFSGALILITHDRYMLDTVCSSCIGLDGHGGVARYASCEQYLGHMHKSRTSDKRETLPTAPPQGSHDLLKKKNKLSYNEQRELSLMEENILKAEEEVTRLSSEVSNNTNPDQLQDLCNQLAKAQEKVNNLYKRWEELESS
jgi:ABC transport system ATP-binding/permease protein